MSKVNRYITLTSDSPSLPKFRKDYLNQHSKFIHSSYCLKEDIDRELEINDIQYRIFGLWAVVGGNYTIMLQPIHGGPFYLADSKEVAGAMGYTRYRNLVTGVEHTWDYANKGVTYKLTTKPVADVEDDEDIVDEHDEDDNEIDPLVKALQDELIDDGDTSNY